VEYCNVRKINFVMQKKKGWVLPSRLVGWSRTGVKKGGRKNHPLRVKWIKREECLGIRAGCARTGARGKKENGVASIAEMRLINCCQMAVGAIKDNQGKEELL